VVSTQIRVQPSYRNIRNHVSAIQHELCESVIRFTITRIVDRAIPSRSTAGRNVSDQIKLTTLTLTAKKSIRYF
jgi:hypothetical protein